MRADIQKMFDDSLSYNQYMRDQPERDMKALNQTAQYAKRLCAAVPKIFERAEYLAVNGEELKYIPVAKGKNGKRKKSPSRSPVAKKKQNTAAAKMPAAAAVAGVVPNQSLASSSGGAGIGAASAPETEAAAGVGSAAGAELDGGAGKNAQRNVARNITNVNAISDVRNVQKLFVDLALIMCNPYTTHFLLRCIVSRVRSLYCKIQNAGDAWSTNDVLSSQDMQPTKDLRLKRLCALLLLGCQALRLAGNDPDVLLNKKTDEKSMDVRLPIVQVHHKNEQLVPHTEMKKLFDENIRDIGQFILGAPESSYTLAAMSSVTTSMPSPPVPAQMMLSLALMAIQNGDYELTTKALGLITSKCLGSFDYFLSVDRSQNWLNLYIKSFFVRLNSGKAPNAYVAEATILLLNRIIGKLHHAARNSPNSRSKARWCTLGSQIHFTAAWFTRYCLTRLNYFDAKRIHKICMSFIGTILPPPGSSAVRLAASAPRLSLGSVSPADFSDTSPPASPLTEETNSVPSQAGVGSVANVAAVPPDQTKAWWNSSKFRIVEQKYKQIASPPPRGKNIPELLQAMGISIQAAANGLQSAQGSPLPGSADQAQISPLSTPIDNGTPSMFPSSLPAPSVSPSPLPVNSPLSSSDGATPRSDHASASPSLEDAPQQKRARLA